MKINKLDSIRFIKVNVIPPQSEEFYQLFKDGIATPYIYSQSHLAKVFAVLDDFEK